MGKVHYRSQLHIPGEPEVPARACDMAGCPHEGEYRAPRGRNDLRSYYWFCLDHVREYNAAWNYYAGMSEADVEREIRADTTWQRPSWPFGSWHSPPKHGRQHRVDDPFGVFGEEAEAQRQSERARAWRQKESAARTEHDKALEALQLSPDSTVAAIKTRYKELVKRHHPDANGGDRASEERLKVINQAYSTLMKTISA
jgi:DnaJ-domain-containing protein 1